MEVFYHTCNQKGILYFIPLFSPLTPKIRRLGEKPVTKGKIRYIIRPVLKDTNIKELIFLRITLESADLPETEVIIRGDVTSQEVVSLLQFLRNKNSGKLVLYKEDEQFLIDAKDILFMETVDNRVAVHTRKETYEAKQKLYELKETLTSFSFAQINKSTLVNINFVKSIQAEFSGNYLIKLKDSKDVLTVSRKYFKEFKDQI